VGHRRAAAYGDGRENRATVEFMALASILVKVANFGRHRI
jgi:hypothetical protein